MQPHCHSVQTLAWHPLGLQSLCCSTHLLFISYQLQSRDSCQPSCRKGSGPPASQPPWPQASPVPVGQVVLQSLCTQVELSGLPFLHPPDTFLPPCLCPAHSFSLKYSPLSLLLRHSLPMTSFFIPPLSKRALSPNNVSKFPVYVSVYSMSPYRVVQPVSQACLLQLHTHC